jgi:3-isopropylmalate/(R)-2-methylmalate dehydratase large subunit
MNMIEKILCSHSRIPKKEVKPGEFITVKVDTLGLYRRPLPGYKYFEIWDPDKIWITEEHEVPCYNIDCAQNQVKNKKFAKEYGLRWIEHGRHGIGHQMAAEIGFHIPGCIYACQDSHTTSGGGLNCLAKGIGPLEAAAITAKGQTWYRVVPTIKFNLVGKMPKMVVARDIILSIGGNWPPFVNKNIEYLGPLADNLSLDSRRCIATASTEIGVDFPIFKADKKAVDYVKERTPFKELINPVEPDENAVYSKEYTMDVTDLEPQVACPHSMTKVKPVNEVEQQEIKIDLAFIGACTNGRLEDIKLAAEIIRGNKIHPNVRFIVTPASQEIFMDALEAGYVKDIVEAEGIFTSSRCLPCQGGNLGSGETAVTASTRNFKGRMGAPDSFVYCASPITVAASAILGYITDPREV